MEQFRPCLQSLAGNDSIGWSEVSGDTLGLHQVSGFSEEPFLTAKDMGLCPVFYFCDFLNLP